MRDLVRRRNVLVVGHADADGHLAAEQSRRNALAMGALHCDIFIDPRKTAGHRMWLKHLAEVPIAAAEVVVFVDIMFSPNELSLSLGALIDVAQKNPEKTFVVIDHHPLLGLPALPKNLGVWFTSAVYTCCFGRPSSLMVIAAICDHDEEPVAPMIDDTIRRRALGVVRAVADRDLAGKKLLRLLSEDRWDLIETLAKEPRDIHRRVRGRRIARQPESTGLVQALAAAG